MALVALHWTGSCRSYLSHRKSFVSIESGKSNSQSLDFGVPQGSILGPILFMLYTSPIGDIVRGYDINFHLYADDSQPFQRHLCLSWIMLSQHLRLV
jgi:hypothetical protein